MVRLVQYLRKYRCLQIRHRAHCYVRVALIRAREQAWDDYFDRENPQPMDERIGNEASLARMTALGAVEAVCYQLARAAGEVDNLGLPPPKKGE